MDSPIRGVKGQTVCRSTASADVFLFFALNYGLHVVTTISDPGARTVNSFLDTLNALVLPFTGVLGAVSVIGRFAWYQSDELQIALRARALCMYVPVEKAGKFELVDLEATAIHGQRPSWASSANSIVEDGNESNPQVKYALVVVPENSIVAPLRDSSGSTPIKLSCNYSIFKSIIAIIQIVYGGLGLYEASAREVPKFGYAAYSLTVIPYILMSLVNLLANICQPQYPTMFLVLNESVEDQPNSCHGDSPETDLVQERQPPPPEKTTEGGRVSSDRPGSTIVGLVKHRTEIRGKEIAGDRRGAGGPQSPALDCSAGGLVQEDRFVSDISGAIGAVKQYPPRCSFGEFRPRQIGQALATICLSTIPFIALYCLTGFKSNQSTQSQRGWTIAWVVCGQVLGAFGFVIRKITVKESQPESDNTLGQGETLPSKLALAIAYGVPAIGGFVVVAKMMMQDEVCRVL